MGFTKRQGRWKLSKLDAQYIQLCPLAYVWLLNKPYENEVTLRGKNIPLKCCQPHELLMYIERGLRSFHTGNIGSVGQRATKLLAFKVKGLPKKSATPVITAEVCASAIGSGLTLTGGESFQKFDGW